MHKKTPENLTDAQLYSIAHKALIKQDYSQAIENLKNLESHYPFGPFSNQAQLDLAYAYLKNGDPQSAQVTATRFVRLHPDHPNVDYAYYIEGLATFFSTQHFVERYLPVDVSERDPSAVIQSFDIFSELLNRFPNSIYAADARQRMIAIRNRVAMHILNIANFYLKKRAWVAAINRSNEIILHYQQTPAVELALGIMITSYRHLGLLKEANQSLQILKQNFPNSKLLHNLQQLREDVLLSVNSLPNMSANIVLPIWQLKK